MIKKSFWYLLGCCAAWVTTYTYDYLPDSISMSHVLLPIAHNCTQSHAYGWLYYQQLGTIEDQWTAGARGGKLNLHWRLDISRAEQIAQASEKTEAGAFLKKQWNKIKEFLSFNQTAESPKQKPFIALCHEEDGSSNCLLSATAQKITALDAAEKRFQDFASLLSANPRDIVIIILESYLYETSAKTNTDGMSYADTLEVLHEALIKSGLARFAYKFSDVYYTQSLLWPTVGELRATDKRALIFIDDTGLSSPSPYLNNTKLFDQTAWGGDWQENLEKKRCSLYRNTGRKALLASIGPDASIPSNSIGGWLLKFAKYVGIDTAFERYEVKPTNYEQVNSAQTIRSWLDICGNAHKSNPVNILSLDMIEIGDVYRTVKEINTQRIAQYEIPIGTIRRSEVTD